MARIHRRTVQKRSSQPIQSWWCDHSPRARHPGMWSQVGLRKQHYKQSWWRWWNSNWAILSPKRWCCESAELNMPASLENSAVATGLEKVSFHSSFKEGQCQTILHYCTITLISHASKVMLKILQARLQQYVSQELPYAKRDLEKAEEPEIKLPTSTESQKKEGNSRKYLLLLHWLH